MAKTQKAGTVEQVHGIVATVLDTAQDWNAAYKKAVDDDNAEAMAALIAMAPKLKRTYTKAAKINSKEAEFAQSLEQASAKLMEKPRVHESIAENLAEVASKSSSQRRLNGWVKFVKEVETMVQA